MSKLKSETIPSVREIRSHLPEQAHQRSAAIGIMLTTNSYLLYLAAFSGIVFLPGVWLRVAAAIVSGIMLGVLFVVGHDACHQSLTPNPLLNKILGRITFLPGWQSYSAWDFSHNGLHHAYTNLRTIDPGYPPFSKPEFDALPRYRQRLERIYRSFFGVGLFYYVEVWWKYEMFPTASHRARMKSRTVFEWDRISVVAFAILQCVGLYTLAHHFRPALVMSVSTTLQLLLIGIIFPFVLWMWLMGFLTFQHHTHPKTTWYANQEEWNFYRGHLQSTVHVKFPRWIEIALHNIMDHTAHHVDPKIPLYNLHLAQHSLEEEYHEDIIVEIWNLKSFLHTLRTCQLYDYENRPWLDFSGSPTTEPLAKLTARAD